MSDELSFTPNDERKNRLDGIAGAFLAFAAMMKKDYGVGKKAALLALETAYDMNEEEEKERG